MSPEAPRSSARALAAGVDALLREQAEDGSFEGEVVWCPMLVAQYVMMIHITGAPMPEGRRERVLLNFERTRLPSGLWGLHEQSPPTLFVTTLVYVAARLLGVPADDPLLVPARGFIAQVGGVLAIPSWGKFWLSLLGLYGWDGVNAVLPEAWALPERAALHPRNYYCHTRLIYMGMAALYGRRLTAPTTALTHELRSELYPGRDFQSIDFAAAEQDRKQRDGNLSQQYAQHLPPSTGNLYLMPDGRLLNADDLLYHPTVIAERPEDAFTG